VEGQSCSNYQTNHIFGYIKGQFIRSQEANPPTIGGGLVVGRLITFFNFLENDRYPFNSMTYE
jgi:hypothetical protein